MGSICGTAQENDQSDQEQEQHPDSNDQKDRTVVLAVAGAVTDGTPPAVLMEFLFAIGTVIHKCQPFKDFLRKNTISLPVGKVKKRRDSPQAHIIEKMK